MPFSRVLFRYVCAVLVFKDATRGDRYARAAAYRHNRDMRIHLPGYLLRWVLVSATTFAVASGFGSPRAPRGRSERVRRPRCRLGHRVRVLPVRAARNQLHLSLPEPARALTRRMLRP